MKIQLILLILIYISNGLMPHPKHIEKGEKNAKILNKCI